MNSKKNKNINHTTNNGSSQNKNKVKEIFSLRNKKQKSNNIFKKSKLSLKKSNSSLKNKKSIYISSGQQKISYKVVEKDNTKKVLSGIAVACCGIMVVALSTFFMLDSGINTTSFNNTTINGVNLNGLSSFEAEKLLVNTFSEKANHFELVLKHEGKQWKFDKNNFKVNSNIHTILDEVYAREIANQNYETQKEVVTKLNQQNKNVSVAFNYIFVGLDQEIDKIISQINKAPIDSVMTFNAKNKTPFEISDDVLGIMVNKEKLYHDINEQFVKTNKVSLEIPTIEVVANVTKEVNESLSKKVASFTTKVGDSTGGRKANVNLALERVNGLKILPQQKVSFNELTAPHTQSNGYKVATIIYNGQFVDGVGGGVCQASTTLYNALLRADVEINQAVKHTLPVKYVPLGLDAMVAEGVADLIFTNNKQTLIYVRTLSTPENVTVEIYGEQLLDGMYVEPRSETVKTLPHLGDKIKPDTKQEHTDKVLYKGEQHRLYYPRGGFEVKSYLDYYDFAGKLIKTVEIRHEIYYPQQGLIVEGVQEKPAGFEDIDTDVEKLTPSENTENTFMFNTQTYDQIFESIPTHYCP